MSASKKMASLCLPSLPRRSEEWGASALTAEGDLEMRDNFDKTIDESTSSANS